MELFGISLDWSKHTLSVDLNMWFLSFVILGVVTIMFIQRSRFKKLFESSEVEELEVGSHINVKVKIDRTQQNIFIAHRILVELETRKAALKIDPEQDVIADVYSSWYKLFGVIRDEMKEIESKYLLKSPSTLRLLDLTTRILNDGLRPHLTKYQAPFLRWYEIEQAKQADGMVSPQQIQKGYPLYHELVADLQRVNELLMEYAKQLRKLIYGAND